MDFLKKGGDFFAGLEADLNAGIKDEAPPAVTAAAAPAAADAAVDDAFEKCAWAERIHGEARRRSQFRFVTDHHRAVA